MAPPLWDHKLPTSWRAEPPRDKLDDTVRMYKLQSFHQKIHVKTIVNTLVSSCWKALLPTATNRLATESMAPGRKTNQFKGTVNFEVNGPFDTDH